MCEASLPCNNGFIKTRRNLKECIAAGKAFIRELRERKVSFHEISVDVQCAVCQRYTLVPSDIVNIAKVGICNYCDVVEPQGNFVSTGQVFSRG